MKNLDKKPRFAKTKLDSITYCWCYKFKKWSRNRYWYRIALNPSSSNSCIDIRHFQDRQARFISFVTQRQSPTWSTSLSFSAFIPAPTRQPNDGNNPSNKNSILYWGITRKMHIQKVKDWFVSAVSLFFCISNRAQKHILHIFFITATIRNRIQFSEDTVHTYASNT